MIKECSIRHRIELALASSSRNQFARSRACLVASLACGSVSGVVRRCAPLPPVIVTHLVPHRPSAQARTSRGGAYAGNATVLTSPRR